MYSFYESSRSKKFGQRQFGQRDFTSSNMYLQFKWDMENFATHRYNVKTAKPSIDNSAPRTFTHMFIRPKKLQLELERYSTIQRNNRFLLERLATVRREGAWIDNKNYHEIKSLNTWKRQQEMISLAHNNQIMLARLQDVGAGLNRHKLEDEYLMNQKHKANILKYPPNWREIQEHLVRLKKETFKKVFDTKYQRKEYEKSRKKILKRWATEREKHEAAKAEKLAENSSPDEAPMNKGKGDLAKGQKKTPEKALKREGERPEKALKREGESGREQKLKSDQNKQKTKYMKKKPLRETAHGSASKTAKKEEIGSKPDKVRPTPSTGLSFKGDSKSEKNEISNVDNKQTESSENSPPSEACEQSENEGSVLSTISNSSWRSEESEENGSEKDVMRNYNSAASQDEDNASDFFADGNETKLSDLSDEKTDSEAENSVSSGTSDSGKNFEPEKGNKVLDQSNDTSDETGGSKEEDDES